MKLKRTAAQPKLPHYKYYQIQANFITNRKMQVSLKSYLHTKVEEKSENILI